MALFDNASSSMPKKRQISKSIKANLLLNILEIQFYLVIDKFWKKSDQH